MQKIFIKNRKNQSIVVIIEEAEDQKGLAFVMHGLGGDKYQSQIDTFAKAFHDNQYTVVRFDTTNTFGESDGNYEDATVTNYYQDLEDVINRSKMMNFYQEQFVLCGHSLGGICTSLYAENFPQKLRALAPISTVVSGKLSLETYSKERLEEWEKSGWRTETRSNGSLKKLKRTHMIDRLEYDIIPKANLLTMPVLMIVGDGDATTPFYHQQLFFDVLPGKKEFHVIKDALHTFREQKHLDEIYQIFDRWIKSLF